MSMRDIRCRYATHEELGASRPAAAEHWLAPAERARYDELRDAVRRLTWLSGRILAKQLILGVSQGGHSSRDIDIRSRSQSRALGEAPRVFIAGRPSDLALSIAHTARGVLVAIADSREAAIGVDLVSLEGGAPRHLGWCLTHSERCWLARHSQAGAIAHLWAMKEAWFKAQGTGNGFAPWNIDVCKLAATGAVPMQTWIIDRHAAALAIVGRRPSTSQAA